MHGYAAFEPLVPEIRPAQPAADLEPLEGSPDIEEMALVSEPDGSAYRPMTVRVADAWADLRETWAQTTFFVLDPNSWG